MISMLTIAVYKTAHIFKLQRYKIENLNEISQVYSRNIKVQRSC